MLFSAQDERVLETACNLADAYNLKILGALSKPVLSQELKKLLVKSRTTSEKTPQTQNAILPVNELRQAISNDQIVPFFQPQLDVVTKKLHAVEVLARWEHPTRGILLPSLFIPIAEESGLIDALTRSILRQSLAQLGTWFSCTGERFSISINLSTDSLCQIDLPEQLVDLAKINEIPCSFIILEITESRLLQNLASSLDVLVRLRLKGFGLSIDDFGTGYSCLDQLNKIPFNELKIDRAFVHGASHNLASKAILESSIELARKLKMQVVAEGVESIEDWELVASLKCDFAQGYYVAKPMSASNFSLWVKQKNLIA